MRLRQSFGRISSDAWRPAASLLACAGEHTTRRAAEAELAVRRDEARFRRLILRVTALVPDDQEARVNQAIQSAALTLLWPRLTLR